MDEEKCEGCFYYSNLHCRRNAPVAIMQKSALGAMGVATIWPAVSLCDWCGEWTQVVIKEDKENENEMSTLQ